LGKCLFSGFHQPFLSRYTGQQMPYTLPLMVFTPRNFVADILPEKCTLRRKTSFFEPSEFRDDVVERTLFILGSLEKA